jgi:acyl-CoA thioester hydrolase
MPVSDFAHTVSVTVRWRDLDAFGHVNNAVYASYLEMARTAFWHEHFGCRDPFDIPFVIAHMEIDFKRALKLFDQVHVGIRPSAIGRTSFDLEYGVFSGDILCAAALTRQVCVRHSSGRPTRVPEGLAEALRPLLP